MACDIAKLCVNCDAENATVLHPRLQDNEEMLEYYQDGHFYMFTNRPRLFCSTDCLRQNCREWEVPLLQHLLEQLRNFPKTCKEEERLINLSCKTVENLLSRNSTFHLFFKATKKQLAEYNLKLKINFWTDVQKKIAVLEQKQESRREELERMQKKLDDESKRVVAVETQMATYRQFQTEDERLLWANIEEELRPLKEHIRDVTSKITEWLREIDRFAATKQEIYDNLESPPDKLLELLNFCVDELTLMAPNFVF